MFYKIKLFALKMDRKSKSKIIQRFWRKIRNLKIITGLENGADYKGDPGMGELVKKYVRGKSFADIGCMWGINGYYTFLAEEHGATRSVGVDGFSTKEFWSEKENRNSSVEFIEGDINLKETINKIGSLDVILCAGVLYHAPNPLHLLHNLRLVCNETMIFGTAVIPEMEGMKNMAVFYPFLDRRQRKIWEIGVKYQPAVDGPYNPEDGYANWFWGLTPSCVESMLACTGFKVMERYINPFNVLFVCQTVPDKFLSMSIS